MSTSEHPKAESGQALVEFAFTLPILLLLIFGVTDFARAIFALSQVIDASRQGVRYGIVTGLQTGSPQYLDCQGIRDAARSVPGFTDLYDVTIDVYYEDAQGAFLTDCTDTLTVWDVNHGDVLAVHVSGSIRPLTPIIIPFTETFTFEYTSRRTIVAQGSAFTDEWPEPPQAAHNFTATVDCNLRENNVSFSWDPMEVPDRLEIHDSFTTEIVALPDPQHAYCNACATIDPDGGSGMFYMVAITGSMAGPSSSDAVVNCPEQSQFGSISGLVWYDGVRVNGRQGPGEEGIGGVTVHLTSAGADLVFGTEDDLVYSDLVTGDDGTFRFFGLLAGQYRVDVEESSDPVAGMTLNTSDLPGTPQDITLGEGEDRTGIDFGFY